MSFVTGKVVFVGDSNVGKTSIIRKFMNIESDVSNTVGSESQQVTVELENGKVVPITIWDTAGQESYKCLVPLYANSAHVAVLVFDLTDDSTFQSVNTWLEYLGLRNKIPHKILVGNKMDKVDNIIKENIDKMFAMVKSGDSGEFDNAFQTSAVTGQNIQQLFQEIAQCIASDTKETTDKRIQLTDKKENKVNHCKC